MNGFSDRSGIMAFILLIFFGCIGAHNFYVGKTAKGIFYMFTLGGFIIGYLIDGIKIVRNTFKDKEGKVLDFNGEANHIFKG